MLAARTMATEAAAAADARGMSLQAVVVSSFGVGSVEAPPGVLLHHHTTMDSVATEAWAEASFVGLLGVPSSEYNTIVDRCPKMEVLQIGSAGVEKALSPAVVASDVTLCNAKGVFSHALAEYAVCGMLHFAKDVPRLVASKAARKWDKFTVGELRGSLVGIIGFGDIGRAIARLVKPFGARVGAVTYKSRVDDLADTAFDSLDAMLPEVDYLCMALPLTDATRGIIAAPQLALLKPSAVLVNVGRGPNIVESDLVAALAAGGLRGAVLDVFEVEPLPETSPLWDLPNVLLSSHTADETADCDEVALQVCFRNLGLMAAGKPLTNVVNKALGY